MRANLPAPFSTVPLLFFEDILFLSALVVLSLVAVWTIVNVISMLPLLLTSAACATATFREPALLYSTRFFSQRAENLLSTRAYAIATLHLR